ERRKLRVTAMVKGFCVLGVCLISLAALVAAFDPALADEAATAGAASIVETEELGLGGTNIFQRSLEAGPVVFMVLLSLVSLSVFIWAAIIAKWKYFRQIEAATSKFTKSFWDSRSLNELNGRLADYTYSPIREIFRAGYAELIKS